MGPDVIAGAMRRPAAGPAILPETFVIDHGKIYVSEHLTSVCARMGVSIQAVRLRTGRDKGPIESAPAWAESRADHVKRNASAQ